MWSAVALQITGKTHTGELKGSAQNLEEAVVEQQHRHLHREWTERAQDYANKGGRKIK
jgi:hypothetical protein